MLLAMLASPFLKAKAEIDPELVRLADRYVDQVCKGDAIPERAKRKLKVQAAEFCQEYVVLWQERKGRGIGKDSDKPDFYPTNGLLTRDNPFMKGGLGLLDGFYARMLAEDPEHNFNKPYGSLIDNSRGLMDACAIELLRWSGLGTKTLKLGEFGIRLPNREFSHRRMGLYQLRVREELFDLANNLDNYSKTKFPEKFDEVTQPNQEEQKQLPQGLKLLLDRDTSAERRTEDRGR